MENDKKIIMILVLLLLISNVFFYVAYINMPINVNDYELIKISKSLMNKGENELYSNAVCSDWTNFYAKEFDKLGIKYNRVVLPISNQIINGVIDLQGHTFLIAYTSEGYCQLDQKNINCYMYKNE